MQTSLFTATVVEPDEQAPLTDWEKELSKAINLIEKFCQRARREKPSLQRNQVGCRVRLSAFGREIQKATEDHTGTVIAYSPWVMCPDIDGIVTVKWDGVDEWETMHISQIEKIQP